MDTERINREREFHNHAFSNEVRKTTDKFYSIFYLIENDYQSKLLNEARDKTLLEYGCGKGSSAYLVAQKGGVVTGIDISDFAIDQAAIQAKQMNLQITFRQMNAEMLEFTNQSFDRVCGSGIIHHLDIAKAYSEIGRVLKPEGKAVFMEPMGHNLMINLYRWLTPKLRTADEHPLKRRDIKLLSAYFKSVNLTFFFLFSLMAIPFRRFSFFKPLVKILHGIDKVIFSLLPFMRWQAWFVLIEVQNPKSCQ